MIAGAGLIAAGAEAGSCWFRKMVAGAELVAAAAGKWSPVQEGSCWCRLKGY